jgi:hypothetical protein
MFRIQLATTDVGAKAPTQDETATVLTKMQATATQPLCNWLKYELS